MSFAKGSSNRLSLPASLKEDTGDWETQERIWNSNKGFTTMPNLQFCNLQMFRKEKKNNYQKICN